MTKPVVIVGAGRQGRNVLEILAYDPVRYPVAGFLDDGKPAGEMILDRSVIGGWNRLEDHAFVADHAWFEVEWNLLILQERRDPGLEESAAVLRYLMRPRAVNARSCACFNCGEPLLS